VFTDITRTSPDHILVPALLSELEAAGVRDRDITLLCGTGMHRPSTPEEKIAKLGRAVAERFRVNDNDPLNPEALADLGKTDSGIPLSINRIVLDADLVAATGIVEPHQYAGYSGGFKTLAVGAAGEAMIAHTHGPHMVDHPGTRLGLVRGNPFQEAVAEAGRRAGLRFILNVVQDDLGRPVAVLAGAPESTFDALVMEARKIYEVSIPHRYDVAVAGVGFPKDANIYQASRAPSYLFFAPTCVVRDGGVFIVPASTPEGAGDGIGERRFLETLSAAADMTSLIAELRGTGYPPGAQRAYVMAKVLEKTRVIFVGSRTPDLVERTHMIPAETMAEAFQTASKLVGRDDLDVLVVPHALLTLPVVTSVA
jgi:lactate racemase